MIVLLRFKVTAMLVSIDLLSLNLFIDLLIIQIDFEHLLSIL